ncbi:MAG: lamin tail domain-containing protein, partial [Candidatus Parcubacteria bacterium]|nr:lamin tail domain-containing protein [Candidatus Parcubacteria bacterium]
MERRIYLNTGDNPGNWQTSLNSGGTPKTINKGRQEAAGKNETIEAETEENNQPLIPENEIIDYPLGILFNEILPSPEGEDAKEEWIEIINQNNFEVDISGWEITDGAGVPTAYRFPKNTFLAGNTLLLLYRPLTKITLNNEKDSLVFLHPDGTVADLVEYSQSPLGKSYSRSQNQWIWNNILTPGKDNIFPSSSVPIETPLKTEISLKENPAPNEKLLASAALPISNKAGLILIIALTTAIFFGIIALLIRKKLKIN